MKKAISLLLIALLLFTVSACKSANAPEITRYIPNSQAEVAVSYIYDGKANIATRQLTDTKLKSITLACIYYDITGKQIGKLKLIDCEVSNNKDVTLWQSDCPELAVYIDSVVYSVTDENETEHKTENIDLWESSATSSFFSASIPLIPSLKLRTPFPNPFISSGIFFPPKKSNTMRAMIMIS